MQDLVAIELSNCPNCHSYIEKNQGCPEMTCYVCKYRFCWICGLHSEHIFHKIQINNDETGALCVFINNILELVKQSKTGIRCLPVVYFLLFIFCCIAPPIIYALGIIAGIICYPFLPAYYLYELDGNVCPPSVNNKCAICISNFLFLILLFPALLLLGVILAVIAAVCIALYYIIGAFLILRMIYQQCCVSRSQTSQQKKNIQQLMERRRSEYENQKKSEQDFKRQYTE